jgi:hypothetical protein
MQRTCKATFAAAIRGGILFVVTALSVLTAQVVLKPSVDVTVTDPHGRTVGGLERDNFTVTEAGDPRSITAFSEVRDESPKDGVHYKLEFESAGRGAKVEVVLNVPRGLPPLTVTWK